MESPDRPPTGEEIRSYRESEGLTQVELATALGVHPSTVQKWESDAVKPRGLARTALIRRMSGRGDEGDDAETGTAERQHASRAVTELVATLRERARLEVEDRLLAEVREAHETWLGLSPSDRAVIERFVAEVSRRSGVTGFTGRLVARIADRGSPALGRILDDLSPELLDRLERIVKRSAESGEPG